VAEHRAAARQGADPWCDRLQDKYCGAPRPRGTAHCSLRRCGRPGECHRGPALAQGREHKLGPEWRECTQVVTRRSRPRASRARQDTYWLTTENRVSDTIWVPVASRRTLAPDALAAVSRPTTTNDTASKSAPRPLPCDGGDVSRDDEQHTTPCNVTQYQHACRSQGPRFRSVRRARRDGHGQSRWPVTLTWRQRHRSGQPKGPGSRCARIALARTRGSGDRPGHHRATEG
jgi:hypothetical protein